MPGPSPALTLVIPQLFDRFRGCSPAPRLPALETLLARGTREARTPNSCPRRLFELFGYTTVQAPPLGAVQRVGDGLPADDGWWFCAAPVHYLAERDRVHLVAAPDLQVDPDEAAALAQLFNSHFAQEGWLLEAPHPHRWYLRAPCPQAVPTIPLEQAIERDLRGALPAGPDALQWHRFLNEVQMLFHGSGVNGAREARGERTINGIWPWGGGSAPILSRRFDRVWADDPLARGLALLSGAGVEPPFAWQRAAGEGLAVLCAEPATSWWLAAEAHWFAPARAALAEGVLETVLIEDGVSARFRVTRGDLRRWWRRRRPVGACS